MDEERRLCVLLGLACATGPPHLGGERVVYELERGLVSPRERLVAVSTTTDGARTIRGIGERGEHVCTALAEMTESVALFIVDEDAGTSRPCRWPLEDAPLSATWGMDRLAIGSPLGCAIGS